MKNLDSSNDMPQRKTKYYTILVGGPTCEAYPVDKDFESLLRAASPILATKLDVQEEIISLPTFEPQDFRIYKDWLHARRLAPSPKIGFEDTTEWRRICQGYLLGDNLQDMSYCNAMADVLLRAASKVTAEPSKDFLATAEHVFNATGEESPIRTLLFDITLHWVRSGIWKPLLESSPKFSAALCIEQINRSGSIPSSPFGAGADICKYHHHQTGESCHAGTEASLWTSVQCMFNDWICFVSINFQGVRNSFQAFRPCVSSTYTVLNKLGTKCKAALSWCARFLKAHL